MSKQYNGWTNYETWAANLWLTNDQGDYETWLEAAKRMDWIDLANYMRDIHEDEAPELTGMFADLLNAAMDEVNWREIAKSFIADAKELEEYS